MKSIADRVTGEALNMAPDDRLELAHKLIESLDFLEDSEDAELKQKWSKEALRRRDEVRSGLVKTISKEEAMRQMRLVGSGEG